MRQNYLYNNTKYFFLGSNEIFNKNKNIFFDGYLNLVNVYDKEFKIFSTSYDDLKIDNAQKIVLYEPKKENSRIVFYNGTINGWKIVVKDQREITPKIYANLTGCVTFYKVNFVHAELNYENSLCEDAFNFIEAKGDLSNIIINNAKYDALDADFSNVDIKNIEVTNAGNDCIDFSYGSYLLEKVDLNNCFDKGISLGEGSFLKSKSLKINKAEIGLASKDSSLAKLQNLQIDNVKNCLAAYNKKKEFNGGKIEYTNLNCENFKKKIFIDQYSDIVEIKK